MHPCKFPTVYCVCVKNYESWLAVDKSYCNNKQAYFSGPDCRLKGERRVITTVMTKHKLHLESLYSYLVTDCVRSNNGRLNCICSLFVSTGCFSSPKLLNSPIP